MMRHTVASDKRMTVKCNLVSVVGPDMVVLVGDGLASFFQGRLLSDSARDTCAAAAFKIDQLRMSA